MNPPPPRVRLAHLAREAARTCTERPCTQEFQLVEDGPFPSVEILALLTFSYGTGVFPVDRISHLARTDVLYLSLIGTTPPAPDTLRAFRRLERIAVASALGRFFALIASTCEEESQPAPALEEWRTVLKLAHPLPRCEATLGRLVRERVNQATWIDRMLLDY